VVVVDGQKSGRGGNAVFVAVVVLVPRGMVE
jgi:hypothetical protein